MNAAERLNSHLLHLASRASQGAAYPTWPDDFARKEVAEVWRNQPQRWTVSIDDLKALSGETLDRLGFHIWRDDLRLVPLWAFHLLADGEELESIQGDRKIKGVDEIDLDVRLGAIAWGFRVVAPTAS